MLLTSRNKLLTLKQGYRSHKLRKTFPKFTDDTMIRYELISLLLQVD